MIFLVGMPASGKTYWGKKISEAFQLPFVDMDHLIVENENKPIHDIFDTEGEDHFRYLEHNTLQSILDAYSANTVVASGGGTPLYYNNMALMKSKGCVIYLKTRIEVLAERLKTETDNTRPLFANRNRLTVLEDLATQRAAMYERSDYIIDAANLSLHTFAQIIQSCIRQQ